MLPGPSARNLPSPDGHVSQRSRAGGLQPLTDGHIQSPEPCRLAFCRRVRRGRAAASAGHPSGHLRGSGDVIGRPPVDAVALSRGGHGANRLESGPRPSGTLCDRERGGVCANRHLMRILRTLANTWGDADPSPGRLQEPCLLD